jgi:hypothetical protein
MIALGYTAKGQKVTLYGTETAICLRSAGFQPKLS